MKHLDTLAEFHKGGVKCVRSTINPFTNLLEKSNPENLKDVASAYVAVIGYVAASIVSPITYIYGGISSLKNKSPTEKNKKAEIQFVYTRIQKGKNLNGSELNQYNQDKESLRGELSSMNSGQIIGSTSDSFSDENIIFKPLYAECRNGKIHFGSYDVLRNSGVLPQERDISNLEKIAEQLGFRLKILTLNKSPIEESH